MLLLWPIYICRDSGVVGEGGTATTATILIVEIVEVMIVLLRLLPLIFGKGVYLGSRVEGHGTRGLLALLLLTNHQHSGRAATA